MKHPNQIETIKGLINSFLDNDLKAKVQSDKQKIYSQVENLGYKRPTVRRVARDLRNELVAKIEILQSETHSSIPSSKTKE